MNSNYDVVVIGTGTAGYTLAYRCNKAGKSVAIVDSRPYGGTCAMRGCQPKKYLVAAAEVVHRSGSMLNIGVDRTPKVNWRELIRSKDAFVDTVPKKTEAGFKEAGIDTYHGRARFIGLKKIQVSNQILTGECLVIATGAKPARLDVPGEQHLTTSEEFMNLVTLPNEIIFIGGGYISFEFAHVANQAGSKVTLIHRDSLPLKHFEIELVEELVSASLTSGIDVQLNVPVKKIEKQNGKFTVSGGNKTLLKFKADLVVHGAGRVPNLEGLDLDVANVEHSCDGINVNGFMQSISNPAIYAVGDAVAAPFRLAPVGDMEGKLAAENILHGNMEKADYSAIPSVVFSLPPLASVGLTEFEIGKESSEIKVNKGDMATWPTSKRIGQKQAAYKVIIDKDSRKILGAHILGHNAGELINIFTMAMKFNLTTDQLQEVLWAYPTYTSDVKYMIR